MGWVSADEGEERDLIAASPADNGAKGEDGDLDLDGDEEGCFDHVFR